MTDGALRFLFVPVSGPRGRGEYARALTIAQGVAAQWPDATIHFIVSRAAPYATQTPFSTTLVPSSPTFHSPAVIELIEQWRPDVVIFDNAGRTAQLRAARRAGAIVVYVSARRRQRRKAFRMHWMRLIDEHWIAYPAFIAGALGGLERLKLRLLQRPTVRYLDVILDSRGRSHESLIARAGLRPDDYALVVPGGGTGHPGARDAVEHFEAAARALAASGIDTVFVGGAGEIDATPLHWYCWASLPQSQLAELMRGAKLILVNGGSTLLQSIACGKPCLAAAIAADQAERIARCVQAGVVVAAPLEAGTMAQAAIRLYGADAELNRLSGRAIALGLADGVQVAVRALQALIATKAP